MRAKCEPLPLEHGIWFCLVITIETAHLKEEKYEKLDLVNVN